MFLVDANLHQGMSGSPVMTKPRRIIPNKTGFTVSQTPVSAFLGVFSGTLSVVLRVKQIKKAEEKKEDEGAKKGEEKVETKEEALGLGAVWYADLIEEIIDNIGK